MKITIATGPWLPVPAINGGAIPRMWQGLAEEFVRRGHDVSIFARSDIRQPNEETINGVRYLRHGGAKQSLSILHDLAKDLIYASSNIWRLPVADILITNDFWMPFLAGSLKKQAGRLVVNANRFPKGQFRLYTQVSKVAAASTTVRDAIVRECPPLKSRTFIVPNPIDTLVMSPSQDFTKRNEVRTILYVGRLHPEKGLAVLIEAFRRLVTSRPNLRLRIVGPIAEDQGGGGDSYERTLKTLAQGLPVDFDGPEFEPRRLAQIYRAANLFCYPSLAENGEALPVAPLESMACGVPAVVSQLECFNDYICDGETGWFFDHRVARPVEALTGKLSEVLSDRSKVMDVASRASTSAKQFSYETVANQYLAEFDSLVHHSEKARRVQ